MNLPLVKADHLLTESELKERTEKARAKKEAGLRDTGVAALIGVLLGKAVRAVPALANARIDNPSAYDAALAAAVATLLPLTHSTPEQPIVLPGQAPSLVPPPGWNLM